MISNQTKRILYDDRFIQQFGLEILVINRQKELKGHRMVIIYKPKMDSCFAIPELVADGLKRLGRSYAIRKELIIRDIYHC